MDPRARLQHDLIGDDHLVLQLCVDEGLSHLFEVDAEFEHADPELDLDAMLGTALLCVLWDASDEAAPPRYFHGVIDEAEYLREADQHHVYRVRARPQLHALAHRARSRIFQNQDVTDIARDVMQGAGVPDDAVTWATTARYPRRVYCVQYQESELAFVLRLLEDEGVFFWFEHTEVGHVMHLHDSAAAHRLIDGESGLALSDADQADRECTIDLVYETNVSHDAFTTWDWNPENPGAPLEGREAGADAPQFERYEYPGGFGSAADGQRRAHNRLAEAMLERQLLRGRSNCMRLAPGRIYTQLDALPEELNRDWLLLGVRHVFAESRMRSDAGARRYSAEFRAVPAGTEFRPARRTPRPRLAHRDSAVVTGPSGEEIHVDAMARIKMHFYWDREGAVDDTATCWIRTQQQNTAGAMILPRVGWELDVAYVDGDPDRPVALQKVYNDETLPPYDLPGNQTQGALQSATTPGGGATNEVRMQDGNGGMEFFVHASRDLEVAAVHNVTETIDVDSAEDVGVRMDTNVKTTESATIGGNQSVSVTGACTLGTGGARTISVGAVDDHGATKNHTISCGGARTDTIDGLMNVLANHVSEQFNAGHSRTVGAVQAIASATAIVEAVGGSKTESVGAAKLEIVAKTKQEQVSVNKTLLSGAMLLKAGADIGVGAKGALAITSAGPVVEKCGDAWTFSAAGVLVTCPGGLTMTAGGSSFKASGGSVKISAGDLGASGGPLLRLKGNINYKT